MSLRTIAGVLGHCRSCSGSQRHLFEAVLKKRVPKRSVHSDVLSTEEIQAVLSDLQSKEPWFYPLFLLWLSTGLRNGEIRGLIWDCVRWGEGELLVCKTLRRDGFKTGQYSWAPTKTGKKSLKRCGLQPRRLYSQRHSFLNHALAMGNSPADLAAAAGHSTKVLLETYAKPTGRLSLPQWQRSVG